MLSLTIVTANSRLYVSVGNLSININWVCFVLNQEPADEKPTTNTSETVTKTTLSPQQQGKIKWTASSQKIGVGTSVVIHIKKETSYLESSRFVL